MMREIIVIVAATVMLSTTVHAFDTATKYKQSCSACHAAGVAGAPKAFDKAAWKPRLALGMDKLVESVTKGKNAMPPRGLCMDCTADQYKLLINYMAAPKK